MSGPYGMGSDNAPMCWDPTIYPDPDHDPDVEKAFDAIVEEKGLTYDDLSGQGVETITKLAETRVRDERLRKVYGDKVPAFLRGQS